MAQIVIDHRTNFPVQIVFKDAKLDASDIEAFKFVYLDNDGNEYFVLKESFDTFYELFDTVGKSNCFLLENPNQDVDFVKKEYKVYHYDEDTKCFVLNKRPIYSYLKTKDSSDENFIIYFSYDAETIKQEDFDFLLLLNEDSKSGFIYTNCYEENNKLFAKFENHNLQPGLLKRELWMKINNSHFNDGYWQFIRKECSNIKLV